MVTMATIAGITPNTSTMLDFPVFKTCAFPHLIVTHSSRQAGAGIDRWCALTSSPPSVSALVSPTWCTGGGDISSAEMLGGE